MKKHGRVDYLLFQIADLDAASRQELVTRVAVENFDKVQEAEGKIVWEDLDDYWGEVESARKDWGEIVGLSSGFWEIDRMTGGFAPGEMTVIGAATGVGKSRLAANMALLQAGAGHIVAYASLENDKIWEGLRFESILGRDGVQIVRKERTLKTLKDKRISPESLRALVRKAKELKSEIFRFREMTA